MKLPDAWEKMDKRKERVRKRRIYTTVHALRSGKTVCYCCLLLATAALREI
jgi:hypothetical protein